MAYPGGSGAVCSVRLPVKSSGQQKNESGDERGGPRDARTWARGRILPAIGASLPPSLAHGCEPEGSASCFTAICSGWYFVVRTANYATSQRRPCVFHSLWGIGVPEDGYRYTSPLELDENSICMLNLVYIHILMMTKLEPSPRAVLQG